MTLIIFFLGQGSAITYEYYNLDGPCDLNCWAYPLVGWRVSLSLVWNLDGANILTLNLCLPSCLPSKDKIRP